MPGALLEMIVALAGIGTAVALYPVVRRQGEARAVGFVASLLVVAWFAVFGGLIAAVGPLAGLSALPIGVWEFSLGVYLTFWGVREAPILTRG